jgi:hypothetical protein
MGINCARCNAMTFGVSPFGAAGATLAELARSYLI